MPHLTATQWLLAILSALGIGVAKSGFAGVSMIHVVIFAFLFGARNSTGVVLPMLIVGDICAVLTFRQHARWDYIRRMLVPACLGVIAAWGWMHRLDETLYKPVIGGIILSLSALQITRMRRPDWFAHIPHAHWFAWSLGLLAGVTTMLANAAGPIMAALAGVGVGGAIGGIGGALIGMGIPEYEAKRYEGRVKEGGILLSVHSDNSEWTSKAKEILKATGADDISSAGEAPADFAKSDRPMRRAG